MRMRYTYPALLSVFALIAVLTVVDLAADLEEGARLLHVTVELSVIVASVGSAALVVRYLFLQLREARAEASDLSIRLQSTHNEAQRWRREAQDLLKGLGAAMDRQFEAWGLTIAEKEVALLLLKGLTHKEIAGIRDVSEATARQQARAVYRKAGVAGRRELAAFFLEDLALPLQR